jgi:hypothetical protein
MKFGTKIKFGIFTCFFHCSPLSSNSTLPKKNMRLGSNLGLKGFNYVK